MGAAVPDLGEAIALAVRAHRAFADFTVIGWDVGLTCAGPVLVEGNWNPGTDILQLVSGRGLSDTRLGDLYPGVPAVAEEACEAGGRPEAAADGGLIAYDLYSS